MPGVPWRAQSRPAESHWSSGGPHTFLPAQKPLSQKQSGIPGACRDQCHHHSREDTGVGFPSHHHLLEDHSPTETARKHPPPSSPCRVPRRSRGSTFQTPIRIVVKTAFFLNNKILEFAKGLVPLISCLLIFLGPRNQCGILRIRNNKPRKNPVFIIMVHRLLNLTAIEKNNYNLKTRTTHHKS